MEPFDHNAVRQSVALTIHALFEQQVERTPDHIAVIFEHQSLTYNELNQKANQLAHYLRRQGIKPDQLLGICIDRSLEMIIGVLGILKAGVRMCQSILPIPKNKLILCWQIADVQFY